MPSTASYTIRGVRFQFRKRTYGRPYREIIPAPRGGVIGGSHVISSNRKRDPCQSIIFLYFIIGFRSMLSRNAWMYYDISNSGDMAGEAR